MNYNRFGAIFQDYFDKYFLWTWILSRIEKLNCCCSNFYFRNCLYIFMWCLFVHVHVYMWGGAVQQELMKGMLGKRRKEVFPSSPSFPSPYFSFSKDSFGGHLKDAGVSCQFSQLATGHDHACAAQLAASRGQPSQFTQRYHHAQSSQSAKRGHHTQSVQGSHVVQGHRHADRAPGSSPAAAGLLLRVRPSDSFR